MSLETTLFVLGSLFIIVLIAVFRVWRRSRLEQRARERLEALGAEGREIPPTLHPVIDSTRCISSASCTLACPQGDSVIGVIQGRGTLIEPSRCIGHGRCAAECPVDAIRLVFGSAQRGVDIPHLRPTFETNVNGLYITGELGGMGLIANAVRQAREGMGNVKAALEAEGKRNDPDLEDVVIVGAGPAGLASALFAVQHGLRYRLLDRENALGGTMLHYPRRKVVMTEPVELPLLGRVFARTLSKEELIGIWTRAVEEHGVKVESGVEVKNISRNADGLFEVETAGGATIRARKVMLCIGRRGTPRKLEVPGEESANVQYVLLDPAMYEGRRVLVVGGGDSALEAACMLAEETSARVTLSYRRGPVTRARPENREKLTRLVDEGKIQALWESQVLEIRDGLVRMSVKGKEQEIAIDDTLVFVGGQLATDFLKRAGIHMERHFGEEVEGEVAPSTRAVFGAIKAQARSKGLKDYHRPSHREPPWMSIGLTILGILAVGAILWWGGEYYFAPPDVRERSEALQAFAPSGIWGQTVGIFALVFMINNFLYFLRKEFTFMKGAGNIHGWLKVHVFSGLTSGVIVLLHSSLYARNLFALFLYLCLAIVVLTGIIGRYIFSFVPMDPRGRPLAHSALVSVSERMAKDFGRLYKRLAVTTEVRKVLQLEDRGTDSLLTLILRLVFVWPLRYLKLKTIVWQAAKEIDDPERYAELKYYAREMFRVRFQMDYLPHLKRLLGLWRSGHAVLAFFMAFLVIAHVIIEFWVGYRWIF